MAKLSLKRVPVVFLAAVAVMVVASLRDMAWLAVAVGLWAGLSYGRVALTLEAVRAGSSRWLSFVSVAVIMSIGSSTRLRLRGALLWAILILAWNGYLSWVDDKHPKPLVVAGFTQLVSTWAIFLGASFWHWPTILILVLIWGASFLVADRLLEGYEERSRAVLASGWALVASECSWIFAVWLVNYILLRGLLVVPQAAVVLSALGYCFGGIYTAHREGRLGRARLVEYLLIGLALILIVIAGTKWSGII